VADKDAEQPTSETVSSRECPLMTLANCTLIARRPSAQAGHIPSWPGSCECSALPPVAVACGWSLLLLTPLLSAAILTVRVLAAYLAEVFRGSDGGKSACRWTSFQSPSMRR